MPSKHIKTTPTAGGRKKPKHLNDKQRLFVRYYCEDLNATNAAKKAGYPGAGTGSRLIKNTEVREAIRRQIARRARETEINAERVLCELAMVAFADPGEMFNEDGTLMHLTDMPPEVRKMVSSLDVETRETKDGTTVTFAKVRFWNKLEALNMIGKHLGILGSQVEQKHLHLHSEVSNPFLNAPADLLLQAKSALANLQNSTRGNIAQEDNTVDGTSTPHTDTKEAG